MCDQYNVCLREFRCIVRRLAVAGYRVYLNRKALIADFQRGVLDEGDGERFAGSRLEAFHVISRNRLSRLCPGEIAAKQIVGLEEVSVQLSGGGSAALSAPAIYHYRMLRG